MLLLAFFLLLPFSATAREYQQRVDNATTITTTAITTATTTTTPTTSTTPTTTTTTTQAPSNTGFLMAGGGDGKKSVEVYMPGSHHSCALPDLPYGRRAHTVDRDTVGNIVLCGGGAVGDSNIPRRKACLTLKAGTWVKTHTLRAERNFHSSWATPEGIRLLGSHYELTTTELVTPNSDQGAYSFPVFRETQHACSIPEVDGTTMVITGGELFKEPFSFATRYDVEGFLEELPRLKVARYDHGCGAYARPDGNQALLVAGGFDGDNFLASVEVYSAESGEWVLGTPLPRAHRGIRGLTVDNILYMTGGSDHTNSNHPEAAEILAWSDEAQEFLVLNKMRTTRTYHAMTTINIDDEAYKYCV